MQNPSEVFCELVAPRRPEFGDCLFYHTQTLPDGEVRGQWDLRAGADAYLGQVDFAGQSVLEVGPASGFLSFHMERAGATVTCLEPPMSYLWDMAPSAGMDVDAWRRDFSDHIGKIRNSFWYCHALHGSRVRMFEADPYAIPPAVGDHDVGVMASVLLHTRSPFSMLESLARRVKKTMIVAETHDPALGNDAVCRFVPRLGVQQADTWWQMTPQFIVSALGVLGFPEARVTFHQQKSEFCRDPVPMFTVVAERQSAAADSH